MNIFKQITVQLSRFISKCVRLFTHWVPPKMIMLRRLSHRFIYASDFPKWGTDEACLKSDESKFTKYGKSVSFLKYCITVSIRGPPWAYSFVRCLRRVCNLVVSSRDPPSTTSLGKGLALRIVRTNADWRRQFWVKTGWGLKGIPFFGRKKAFLSDLIIFIFFHKEFFREFKIL